MADRVLISGILNDMGIKLHMSSFKGTQRTQLTSSKIIRSENISKVRIHVERAIQRIKTFHILDGEDKLSMKDIAEQIFTVCAYLVKFQSPIVKT
jgi:acetylglutamate kinase